MKRLLLPLFDRTLISDRPLCNLGISQSIQGTRIGNRPPNLATHLAFLVKYCSALLQGDPENDQCRDDVRAGRANKCLACFPSDLRTCLHCSKEAPQQNHG